MNQLHWELSVLSRAIAYKNLSGAAANIGLSQPQLSRIVSKLEQNLDVTLLDRSSRRQSGWTPTAYQLAECYSRASTHFEKEIAKAIGTTKPKHLRIGTLEGLAPLASEFSRFLFDSSGVNEIDLDVHDLNRLEELFFKGELDLIFISREPGRKKFKFSLKLGYQSLDLVAQNKKIAVLSSFEHQTRMAAALTSGAERTLVSNSLAVRKIWIEKHGGSGIIPSGVQRSKAGSEQGEPVYLLASDLFSAPLWKEILKFKF